MYASEVLEIDNPGSLQNKVCFNCFCILVGGTMRGLHALEKFLNFNEKNRGLGGVAVRVLVFNLSGHQFESRPGHFMLKSW